MKIAFVYDRVNKFGGAERVLIALHNIWPNAPLFTAVYNPQKASWASVFQVKPSFLQSFPLASSSHELYPIITPLAFESFNLSDYDVVLSVTSAEAKGIVTSPDTIHICYCLTPTRYLWSGYQNYLEEPGVGVFNPLARFFIKMFAPPLRAWDVIASNRPDLYIAISKTVADRIKKYYRKKSQVIYPPIDVKVFKPKLSGKAGKFFLIVSRLVPYKKIDYAIRAFNKLGDKLIVIGSGIDENRLKKIANKNVNFINSYLTDRELACYYQNCHALIFPGEEDFGLTAVEVQACGKPVIAFSEGGVCESIISHVTGELYDEYSENSLINAIKLFKKSQYEVEKCRNNAIKFSLQIFQTKMKQFVETAWEEHQLSI